MRQQTLTDDYFGKFRKKPRNEQFLADIEQIVPWEALTEAIEPYYGKRGARRLGCLLRFHIL